MASTTHHFVLILVLILGSVGGELAPLASAAGGGGRGRARVMIKSELTTTATTPATPPGSASAGELMAAGGSQGTTTTAGISPLLRQKELALLLRFLPDFGANCSSWDCRLCVTETIGSCLVHTLTCVNPRTVLMCFAGKFTTIEGCLDTGELTATSASAGGAGAERELTLPPGSAGGKLTSPRPAGGTTTGVSTLLSNCSNNCMRCLLGNIASCSIDAMMCVDPWEFLMCLVDNFLAFKECINTA